MKKVNKTELKNFAIESRRQLIEQVKTKVLLYGIDEKNSLEIQEQFGQLMINNKPYPLYMKPAFNSLKNQLKQKGYNQLVEEVAYTWFNRIIAIRYMEVHDYLPERVNVLSSSAGRVDPDILFEYETMNLNVKQEKIHEALKVGDTEGAYRQLFIAQCNALNPILPFMFEKIQDYTELLLPDFLLDAESVIKVLVQNDNLTNSFEEIEVIGWLYQYYIADEKGRVFAQKSKYKKEEIPFATQLFTPKWIVQYMVQNSLGRYWTEAHREDEDLISKWEYFIKHEEEDFHEKIAPYVNKELRVEDIKLLDPAMGSGHILVYAFEVFYQIYEKCGYPEREIPRLIIENNLYGLDIDDRAYQLSAFAVVMKAASYSRRFLRGVEREGIQLNLASIQETNHISDDVIAYIAQEEVGDRYNHIKAFFDQYHNAKTYGSLINITERDITFIEERLEYINNNPVEDLFYGEQHDIAKVVLSDLVQQTQIMRNEYDIVVMNPPYMGNNSMNKELSEFLKNNYFNVKLDLYSAFMKVDFYLKSFGFYAAINQHSWMFLSSCEVLRDEIIKEKFIDNMLHLGSRAFEDLAGEVVQSTAFVLRNFNLSGNSIFIRVVDEKNPIYKKETVVKNISYGSPLRYDIKQKEFLKISGNPIAYWEDSTTFEVFNNFMALGDFANVKRGMTTSDNNRFLRFWPEVKYNKIYFNATNHEEALNSKAKWFPYSKGGGYRKWYGFQEYLINWENSGYEVIEFAKKINKSYTRTIVNIPYYFLPSASFSYITTGPFSTRYIPEGFLYDSGGPGVFVSEKYINFIIGLMNSKPAQILLKMLNPTINLQIADVVRLPLPSVEHEETIKQCNNLVQEAIGIAKVEWDSFETSWNFVKSPLLNINAKTLNEAFNNYSKFKSDQFNQLKSIEEKLNGIYSSLYGLDDLSPDVVNEEVSIAKAEMKDSAVNLFSYFIGCLTGRYTLSTDGLIYAGGDWDDSKYDSFTPYKNGVIHFTESAYFENDIIIRLREFLAVAFSPDTVEGNMQWLAEALEMKKGEDAEVRLRRYFLDEFFGDHCKMYQKRPIYWLVDSGKQKGLRTLIYMHRYQPDTMATVRFEHLQEIQAKYQNEMNDLENRLVNPSLSASEKKKLTAEKTSFEKKIDELREFDKRLAEFATEGIEIDLDDGVKVNYEKFYRGGKGVLAKIK